MATVKISELPAILGANTAATDVLPIVDVSGNITNKITREEFFKNIQTDVEIADKIVHSGDTNTAIRFPAADTVTVETAGTERLRVDSSGYVGIAKSSPAAWLDIGASGEAIRLSGSSTNAYIRNTDGTTNQWYIGSGGAAGLQHYIYAAQPMTFHTNGTERMRIDSSGNVGIGTSTMPAGRRLVVSGGNIRLDSDYQIEWGGSTVGLYGHGANNTLHLFTNTTERMRVDNSGNVGIGTTSPQTRLHVVGGLTSGLLGTSGNYAVTYNPDTAGNSVFWTKSDGYFAIGTGSNPYSGGTERLRLDASGNLGLGVTPSAWWGNAKALQVLGASMLSTGVTNSITANAFLNSSPAWIYYGTGNATHYEQTSGQHRWFNAPSGTAGNAITFTQAMTLDASGNLGLGITNPAYKLVVSAAGASGIEFGPAYSGTANLIQHYSRSGGVYVDAVNDAAQHRFNTSGTERLRIDASGNITQANAVSGSGAIVGEQTFRLAANVTAFGPAIGDFFGATSAISLEASSVYEIVIYAVFTKTTAGTATWTLTASSAPTRMIGSYQATPITGVGAGASTSGFAGSQGATTAAFAATGSLTTAVNHVYQFKVQVQTNLAASFKLQLTQGAGTATPLAGSYYTVKKISATTGTFV